MLAQIAPDNPACRAVLQDPAHSGQVAEPARLSESLGDFLIRHPEAVSVLARDGIHGARERIPPLRGEQAMLDLRVAYRRELINVAARDLCGESTLEQTMVELTALADAALQAATSSPSGKSVRRPNRSTWRSSRWASAEPGN